MRLPNCGWIVHLSRVVVAVLTVLPFAASAQQALPKPERARTAPDLASGNSELAALREMLEDWAARPGWPRFKDAQLAGAQQRCPLSEAIEGDPCPEISTRLALFPARFGLSYRECPGWSALSESAARTYDDLTRRFPAHEPYLGLERFADTWFKPAWTAVKALLLDISGRGDEARTVLFGASQRIWDGCCWPDLSEDLFYLTRARAEILDRAGETAAALRWYHEAYYRCFGDDMSELFGRPRPASDLLVARYAILLNEAGESAVAANILRKLDANPRSLALTVTRAVLGDEPLVAAESQVTVFAIPLRDGSCSDTYGAGTAFVIGNRDSPSTWRLAAVSLPDHPERSAGNRISPNCGEDLVVMDSSDARVRPFIEACASQTEGLRWSDGLLALQALDHSAREQLESCLEWWDVNEGWATRAATVDAVARLICGGGPDIHAELLSASEVRRAWLEWLR
jgi:hypothetical protein